VPTFWAALLSDGVHPPGYYLLLRAGLTLFGHSEFALRFFSVLTGTLAVPLTYQLGRTLGGRRCGLVGGLLLAVNPFGLWYAQEARMYSLLLCLSIAGGYAFWKLITQPGPRHWLWLALVSALAFLVHYFAFVFSLAQFIYLVATLRRTHRVLRWWVAAQVAAFLFFLPWAVAIATREGRNFGIGWIRPPTLLDLPLTLSNLALALSNPTWPWTWAGLALVAATAVAGMRAKAKRHPPPQKGSARTSGITTTSYVWYRAGVGYFPPHTSHFYYLLIWLLVPIAFTWFFSLRLPLYVDRFLIICLPPLLLLISTVSLYSTWIARGTMIVLIMVSVIASARLWIDPGLTKEDWRAAASYVRMVEDEGDALVMRHLPAGIPFGYYYQGALALQAASVNRQTTPLDDLGRGHERLWLVYRRPFEATHALAGSGPFTWRDDQEPLIRDWLVTHQSALLGERTFPGLYVVLYELSPEGLP
jgi:uncharacterized membrane protein